MRIINFTTEQHIIDGIVYPDVQALGLSQFHYDEETLELINVPPVEADTSYIVNPFLAALYYRQTGIIRTDFLIVTSTGKTTALTDDPTTMTVPVKLLMPYTGATA